MRAQSHAHADQMAVPPQSNVMDFADHRISMKDVVFKARWEEINIGNYPRRKICTEDEHGIDGMSSEGRSRRETQSLA